MSVCYCGGNYVCGWHRELAEQRAKGLAAMAEKATPKLEANARPATPEETAFARDILRIVGGNR